ncbi:hypothetical protein [Paraburkholderia sp. RL17-337-BIB-A]|uniref:hypothetical protein n=1 Tax=Paraburkholderia sp. RL17-337-BIB-A TaxID=3031636 RepID=UPI0038B99C45
MLSTVGESARIPLSIKIYRGARAGDVTNAGASIVFYERWKAFVGEPGKAAEAVRLLQDIADYNEDDVVSTYQSREWLLTLRPAAMPWSNRLKLTAAGPAAASAPKQQTLRAQALVEAILKPLPPKEEHWTLVDQYRALVARLVFFHQREAKPDWWAVFHRMKMTDTERIEDAECLGELKPDISRPPQSDAQSFRYFYKVPD